MSPTGAARRETANQAVIPKKQDGRASNAAPTDPRDNPRDNGTVEARAGFSSSHYRIAAPPFRAG
jgi:hypothetical protein